ncbi:MAG: Recombination protein [Pseudomonadota bacterium]|jgi:DNA repair protein RecN (Recombination protein N)
MLLSLSIRNIALIEKLDIDFASGFGVLTGETGAGKSLLLDGLMFLTGNIKGGADVISQNAPEATIIAEFDISNYVHLHCKLTECGLEICDNLLIKRILNRTGRNRIFINDSPVTISTLKDICSYLIEINGQNNQRTLLDPSYHLFLLDSFAELGQQAAAVSKAYLDANNCKKEMEDLEEKAVSAEREKDYLAHVSKELEQLAVQEEEEQELTTKRASLSQQDKLVSTLQSALAELQTKHNILGNINSAERILTRNNQNMESSEFSEVLECLEKAGLELSQAVSLLAEKLNNIGTRRDKLEEVEERLFALRAAARKFNCSIAHLPSYQIEVQEKLCSLSNIVETIYNLQEQLSTLIDDYIAKAELLSQGRKKAASRLERLILDELLPLKLDKTRFEVRVERVEDHAMNKSGLDNVTFLLSTNPSQPLSPLIKIASGGELSRFMLGCRVVLSKIKSVPTIIFDEIDTGIGGAVADSVGKRLALLGKNMQVIAVTHQPQVAACGNYHLKIHKTHQEKTTDITVVLLEEEQRVEEIARMLAGEVITKQAMEAARSLLLG